MENEDSRNALYCDPNAYIQNYNLTIQNKKRPSKIVFQEPYERLPSFYLNNNFSKHKCDCVSKLKRESDINNHGFHQNNNLKNKHDFNYNHNNSQNRHGGCDFNNHNDDCYSVNSKQNFLGFDIKTLMPLLGLFNKSGGVDLGSLVGLLNNKNTSNDQTENKSNPLMGISSLLSNNEMMTGILNMFKGGGLNLFGKKRTAKKEIKSTDFEIKSYTRVE